MPDPIPPTLDEILAASLAAPAEVETDAGRARQHNIGDLLKAHRYLKDLEAAKAGTGGPKFRKLIPPGSEG